jgi:glycosyltransferase involved in cell wall biosynthesis
VSVLGGPVVHVSTPRTWRGGEQQLVYLADRLRARGEGQLVLCPAGSELARVCAGRGLPHVTAARRLSVDPLFARAVARTARGAAIVHAHDPHALTAAALAASLFGLRAPIVVHRRVDFPIRGGRFSRWKYDHPRVRRIVCVSRAIADILGPDVRDPSRLRVVYDGIDPARFSGARPDGRLRREFGFPPDVPLVGNVAALAGHKDYFTFVDTAARLLASGVDARFVAIGDGPLRDQIAAHVRRRGLEGKVVLAGFRSDVPAILPELDVFLFTSKEEGLGSSILDAYACRVPVVATAAGGVPELVADGETGLLAPIRDAAALADGVARLLGDRALRERLVSAAARRVLEEFGTEALAERTLAIYREVVEEQVPGRSGGPRRPP